MIDRDLLKDLPGFKQLRAKSEAGEEGVAVLVLLVPGYVAELGFFGLALVVVMIRMGKEGGEAERTAVLPGDKWIGGFKLCAFDGNRDQTILAYGRC